MPTEPHFGEMWEFDTNWRMMFTRRDEATTYWIFLEFKDEVSGKWAPALVGYKPRPMSSFGSPSWRRME